MKEHIVGLVQYEEIAPAIVVVIGKDGAATDVICQRNRGSNGGEVECAVAVVLVEFVGVVTGRQVKIQPAVSVHIGPCLAHGRVAESERHADARGGGDFHKKGARRSVVRSSRRFGSRRRCQERVSLCAEE